MFRKDLLKIKHNDVNPYQGCALLSEPFLPDFYFQRSVVLLTHHTEDMDMGFVLNKKIEISLDELVYDIKPKGEIPVYLGGPLNRENLYYIHNLEFLPNSYKIKESLYLNGDFDLLKTFINTGNNLEGKVKFFFGYSSWEKEQLANEIKEDSWLVADVPNTDVLDLQELDIWKKSMKSLGGKYEYWTKFPKNPMLN